MAPTFDEDNSPGRLRSLWSAGQDLTAAAVDRAELEAALAAAQRDYTAALAARSALLGALAGMQAAYATAHSRAVEAGWSATELTEAGLPAPAARHGGVREPVHPIVAPPSPAPQSPAASPAPAVRAAVRAAEAPAGSTPPAAVPQQGPIPPPSPTRRRRAIREQSATPEPAPPTDAQRRPTAPPAGPRSTWDAEQTANLVTSRSTDNPVWYESMRYSRISPPTAAFDVAELDSTRWTGLPKPGDEKDERGVDQPDQD